MAKQPEKYLYLRAGPGLSDQFPWSRRASSPPPGHGEPGDIPGPARKYSVSPAAQRQDSADPRPVLAFQALQGLRVALALLAS